MTYPDITGCAAAIIYDHLLAQAVGERARENARYEICPTASSVRNDAHGLGRIRLTVSGAAESSNQNYTHTLNEPFHVHGAIALTGVGYG